MHKGGLAELATGEGKTLSASLPVFLNALMGKGVHVTTVNDYLARRDAELIGPVYKALGLTIGCVQMQMGEQDRQAAYRSERHLRHRLGVRLRLFARPAQGRWRQGPGKPPSGRRGSPARSCRRAPTSTCRRGHHYGLVDERTTSSSTRRERPDHLRPDAAGVGNRGARVRLADDLAKAMRLDQALHVRRQEAEAGADRRGPAGGALQQPAVGRGRPRLDGDGQAARAPRTGAAGAPPLPPRPALHGGQGKGHHHRRVHRPAHARPALARGLAPGGRGQGEGADPLPLRPRGADHLPELLPAVREAGGHDGHGGAELVGDLPRLQAVGGVRADQPPGDPQAAARPCLP